jgi:hypothetical protein
MLLLLLFQIKMGWESFFYIRKATFNTFYPQKLIFYSTKNFTKYTNLLEKIYFTVQTGLLYWTKNTRQI